MKYLVIKTEKSIDRLENRPQGISLLEKRYEITQSVSVGSKDLEYLRF